MIVGLNFHTSRPVVTLTGGSNPESDVRFVMHESFTVHPVITKAFAVWTD